MLWTITYEVPSKGKVFSLDVEGETEVKAMKLLKLGREITETDQKIIVLNCEKMKL